VNSAAFTTPGVWCIWVNDTTTPVDSLTPDIPVLDPAPYLNAQNETDNTHVMITGGGFYWQLLVGWNIISVPMNTTLLYGATFTASEAYACVLAADLLYPGVLTECTIASRTAAGTYETYDGAGIDFVMDLDHAYWAYVDVAIPYVYVMSDDLEAGALGDPAMGIAAGGINTVSLNAGWNMVNSGLNASASYWLGETANFVDPANHQGWASQGVNILFTGGSFGLGYYGWYDQPNLGLTHEPDDNTGVMLVTSGVLLTCAATWNPTTQLFDAGNSYDDWFGCWNYGSAYNNQGRPVYYASGFWVYAAGAGSLTYDISQ
jgi:hypothetical protein